MAAVCLKHNVQPRAIPSDRALLGEVRRGLCSRLESGVPLALWPFQDIQPEHNAYEAVNLLAAGGYLPLARTEIDFRPDEPADDQWRNAVIEHSLKLKQCDAPPAAPSGNLSRGEFAIQWWRVLEPLPDRVLQQPSAEKQEVGSIFQ